MIEAIFTFSEDRDGGTTGSVELPGGHCAYCILENPSDPFISTEAVTTAGGTEVCGYHVRYALENHGGLGGYLTARDESLVWRPR